MRTQIPKAICRGTLIGVLAGGLVGTGAIALDAWILTRGIPNTEDRFSLALRLFPAGLQIGLLSVVGTYALVGLFLGLAVGLLVRLCRGPVAEIASRRPVPGEEVASPSEPEHRPHFSLVGLLLLIFVVGVSVTAAFWLRGSVDSWSAGKIAAEHAIRTRAAADILARLQRECVNGVLDLRHTAVTDDDIASLVYLPEIRQMLLSDTAITDAGVLPLMAVPTLEILSLADTAISDDALRWIGHLSTLQELYLSGTRIRGPGLQHLGSLAELRLLVLTRSSVDSQSLQHLPPLPALDAIDLCGTAVDDKCLSELARQPTLRNVGLGKTRVTDNGFRSFSLQKPGITRSESAKYRDE